MNGKLEVKNAAVNMAGFPNGIYNANGTVGVLRHAAPPCSGSPPKAAAGKVRLGGFVGYEGGQLVFRMFAARRPSPRPLSRRRQHGRQCQAQLTGTEERSMLAGASPSCAPASIRTRISARILATSAEPVRIPSATTGILSGMHFDVQIETSPDMTFESSLAQDIQIEANLRLRGTATNPVRCSAASTSPRAS